MNIDDQALSILHAYTEQALDAQDTHVADQLRAALAEGRAALTITWRDGDAYAVVHVDERRLCEIDVRNLVPLDDLL